MARKITSIKPLMNKARACKVKYLGGHLYSVTSATSGETYLVDIGSFICTCPRQLWITDTNDFVNACSHVQAALIYRWLEKGYWLVSRGEEADVSNLKRKIVRMSTFRKDAASDGVYFTARKIPHQRIKKNLGRMENE